MSIFFLRAEPPEEMERAEDTGEEVRSDSSATIGEMELCKRIEEPIGRDNENAQATWAAQKRERNFMAVFTTDWSRKNDRKKKLSKEKNK